MSITIGRAGNVIGGGDWSIDRVVPDCMRSWSNNKVVKIRNPNSTRPWQHVLEVVRGYLQSAILSKKLRKKLNGEAFNFGPNNHQNKNVIQLVKEMKKHWVKVKWKVEKLKDKKIEAKLLKLNSAKSKKFLSWKPILNFNEAVELTTLWYKQFYKNKDNCFKISRKQILQYEKKFQKLLKNNKKIF